MQLTMWRLVVGQRRLKMQRLRWRIFCHWTAVQHPLRDGAVLLETPVLPARRITCMEQSGYKICSIVPTSIIPQIKSALICAFNYVTRNYSRNQQIKEPLPLGFGWLAVAAQSDLKLAGLAEHVWVCLLFCYLAINSMKLIKNLCSFQFLTTTYFYYY